ncbi:MAG: type II toxin-antitoxin system VapC family toxin [Planctomycetota bacterium]
MSLLLDTNAYSALRRGDSRVERLIRQAPQILMSAIVKGELLSGFRVGSRYNLKRAELEEFLAAPFVKFLPVTLITADRFALVFADLRAAGSPIPTNDIWIAAHALETGAELLSEDQHFAKVRGLAWIDPART